MPLHPQRFSVLPSALFLHLPSSIRVQSFSASAFCLARSHGPTYYEILDVPVTATTAEIKKQFYSLSLRHHPDKNRKDPKASGTFASISSAYQVLGNASKRAHYDRDNNIHRPPESHHGRHAHSHQHHHGSFSSSSAASAASSHVGSRPASGLSKRRGPFRGPPPSFYAHGGHGASGRSTGETASSGPSSSSSSSSSSASSSSSSSSSHTTKSYPDDPTSFINHNPVSHFNARSHFRTQSHEDARRILRRNRAIAEERERRRAMGEDVDDAGGSHLVRFLVVGGMLTVAGMVASVMRHISEAGTGTGTGTGEKRKKVGGGS